MKLILESTEKIVDVRMPGSGALVPTRVWQGHTDQGVEVHCYITRVAVAHGLPTEQFERDLQEHAPMRPEIAAIPTRLVL